MLLRNPDEAIDFYRQALEIAPRDSAAHNAMGKALSEVGQLEEARKSFRQAIACNPFDAEAHCSLSSITRHTEHDAEISAMENIYTDGNISNEQRMNCAFGLAKAHEDLGKYEKAFTYMAAANKLKRGAIRFNIKYTAASFRKLAHSFSLLDTARRPWHDFEPTQPTPIFILGMPRSGTTLVEQILASHPRVYGAGELGDLQEIIFDTLQAENFSDFVERFGKQHETALQGSIGEQYIGKIRSYAPSADYITDKMPDNFLYIGIILHTLPGARIIHCKRNPMDNCLSIYKNNFEGRLDYAYDLKELGEYYLLYRTLMKRWEEYFPGKIYTVEYESMVSDQENETRGLLEFCELPWDDACLSFHKTKRQVSTVSVAQVRQPVYKTSVELWRRYERQLAPLKKILERGGAIKGSNNKDSEIL